MAENGKPAENGVPVPVSTPFPAPQAPGNALDLRGAGTAGGSRPWRRPPPPAGEERRHAETTGAGGGTRREPGAADGARAGQSPARLDPCAEKARPATRRGGLSEAATGGARAGSEAAPDGRRERPAGGQHVARRALPHRIAPQSLECREPQRGDGTPRAAAAGLVPGDGDLAKYGRINMIPAAKVAPVPILDNRHCIPSKSLFLAVPGRKSASEVYTNARAKIDLRTGEIIQYVVASRPIFKADPDIETDKPERSVGTAADTDGKLRAARRAKARLYDLCLLNDFDCFITLTLDDNVVDGYDYKKAVRKLCQWCDNRVRRKGLKYVIVPEKHPSSGRIHFHGLINSAAVKLSDSGHRDGKGRVIYNVIDWGYGFTTAEMLDGTYEAVCMYIAKYMTKAEAEMARGTLAGRYYYHSHNLLEPGYIYFNTSSSDDLGVEEKVVEIDGAGLSLRYIKPGKQHFKEGSCNED